MLFALGLICLLVVDIMSRGEHGSIFHLLKGCLSWWHHCGLLTLNTWISEMKYEWHNGFWGAAAYILTCISVLGLFRFLYIGIISSPQIVPLLKNVFRTVGQSDCLAFCSEL